MTTDQGAREALVERIAEAMDEAEESYWHGDGRGTELRHAAWIASAVLPLVDAEVAAAVSEAQAERDFERAQCARLARIADDYAAEAERVKVAWQDERARAESAEAEVERLREVEAGIRALAVKWERELAGARQRANTGEDFGEIIDKERTRKECAAELRALLSPSPAATTGEAVHHDEGCVEWCNHCEVCGQGTPYGSRCPSHPLDPAPVSSGEAATSEGHHHTHPLVAALCPDCSAFRSPKPDVGGMVRTAMADLCHHCGQPPEADGDHSCPCPYTDGDCPHHPAPVSSGEAGTGEAHHPRCYQSRGVPKDLLDDGAPANLCDCKILWMLEGDTAFRAGKTCPSRCAVLVHPGQEHERWMAGNEHDCTTCHDCVHDGKRCCGCYDGACCKSPAWSAPVSSGEAGTGEARCTCGSGSDVPGGQSAGHKVTCAIYNGSLRPAPVVTPSAEGGA